MLTVCIVLADESKTCMRLIGVEKVDELGPQHVCPWISDGYSSKQTDSFFALDQHPHR